jgi:hypothetical protein
MSVSKFSRVMDGASVLWVDSKPRAIAFLVAAFLVGAVALLANQLSAWRLLAYATPKPAADNWETVSADLTNAIASGSDVVVLLGGSTARELTGSDAFVSQALARSCGRPIRFVNSGTTEQDIAESWSLADAIPARQRALVVVAINYFSFEHSAGDTGHDLAQNNFPFPVSRDLAAVLPATAADSPYAAPLRQLAWIENHLFAYSWTPRIGQLPDGFSDPFASQRNSYLTTPQPLSQKEALAQRYVAERFAIFDTTRIESSALWRAFAEHERRSGVRVLFLAAPESPTFKPVDEAFGAGFRQSLGLLTASGASVVDLRNSGDLAENDFYDQQHLLSSGRRKFFPDLLAQLRRSVPHCSRNAP